MTGYLKLKIIKLMKLKNNKILLVMVLQYPTKHIYKSLGVDTSYNGWKIMYWNLLPLLNKKLNKVYSKKGHRIKTNHNWINISSLASLKNEIKKMPKNFYYVSGAAYFFINVFLDRLLSILGGKKIVIHSGADYNEKINYQKVIKDLFVSNKILLLKKIFYYIVDSFKKFVTKILQTRPNIFFVANYKTYLDLKNMYKNKKIYKIDSPEFENFLALKRKKFKSKKNILFIDQDMPQAYDYKLVFSGTSMVTKKSFWEHMEKIFCLFNKKFRNFYLTIAASPRRNKYDVPGKRNFIFDQTLNLIRNSDLILAQHSLALKYAVLLRKPIVFLDIEFLKFESYQYGALSKFYAKELGSKTVNINSPFLNNKKKINIKHFFKINEKKYKKFESYYIAFPGLKSQGRWKTILKHLDNNKFN